MAHDVRLSFVAGLPKNKSIRETPALWGLPTSWRHATPPTRGGDSLRAAKNPVSSSPSAEQQRLVK